METEIKEESNSIRKTVKSTSSNLDKIAALIQDSPYVVLTGSGTSFHAGNIFQINLSRMGIPALVIRAPEFPYYFSQSSETKPVVFLVSQSGESKDILESLNVSKNFNFKTVGVSNERESSLIRNCDIAMITDAGKENSVAATKSFVVQLIAFTTLYWKMKGKNELENLEELAKWMENFSEDFERFSKYSRKIRGKVILLGNGLLNPIAMEGALKLKETANLVTESHNIREYLHGPIQTLDRESTVIILGNEIEKYPEIMQKISKHAGNIIRIGEGEGSDIVVWRAEEELKPIAYVLPLQILSCLKSIELGIGPDRPSKLSKVVDY